MKNYKVLIILYTALLPMLLQAQTVEGSWYGTGTVSTNGVTNSYLSELILTQTGDAITGQFNYYFKNAYFTNKVTGYFDKKSRVMSLKTTPVIFYRSSVANGVDCSMEGEFKFMASKTESSISGSFMPNNFYKYTCPPITIKFKKGSNAAPLELYAEDDNKKEEEFKKEEIIKKEEVVQEIILVEKPPVTEIKTETPPVVAAFKKRETEEQDFIVVDSAKLLVYLYDNGEMDHDSISVFYNKQLQLYNKELSTIKPITMRINVDTLLGVNEISMFAENLGLYPPNTALMIIYDGEKRHEIKLTSTLKTTATVRIRKRTWKEIQDEKMFMK
jgi:hypothetical protein